tara:strand:- start:1112 stop:1339 length:228 start_codon:yes stop_codon:yes gene_type:complete
MFSHPKNVCMTYLTHLQFSSKLSILFLIASFKAFTHAVIPDIYITSSSDTISEIKELIENSGCNRSNNNTHQKKD